LLLTDRRGFPVAVLEYQGSGHGIGSTAGQRDDIKRQALERAGVRYREVRVGTTPDEMQQIIRQLLTVAAPGVWKPTSRVFVEAPRLMTDEETRAGLVNLLTPGQTINRRELRLDNGKVVVDVPRLMTDEELAAIFEAFVKEVRGRPPKGPAEPPEPPKGSPLPPHRYPKKRR
jgi:hypothetical protein